MTGPGFQDRLARHLEGTLAPEETSRLHDELLSDDRARGEFVSQQELHHDLRRLLSPGADERAFARGILNSLSGERKDSDVFARDVAARVRRSRWTRRDRAGWSAAPWLVAAAALVAFIGVVLLSARGTAPEPVVRRTPPPEVRTEERPREVPPEAPIPPAPAPKVILPERPREEVPPPAARETPSPREPVAPPVPAKPPGETLVAAVPGESAVLEKVEGAVRVETEAGRQGQTVRPGQAVAADGRAVLAYEDGTRVELKADSSVRLGTGSNGKTLALERGALAARVAAQPVGRPFVVSTPHGQARVVGTHFLLALVREGTRLDVFEGKVNLTRSSDGASVDVGAGQFAVAGKGVALLTRAIPEEPKTVFLELEEFGTARGTKPADGLVKRPFLEPFDTAHGGRCLAVPGNGMEVTGDVRLAKATWHLWVRHRDEPGNAKIAFHALLGDQLLGTAATPGQGRAWVWKKFTFAWPGGTARLTLRSTYEGVKATPDRPDYRQSPYGALNRWDRVCLTPDESFTPE